MDLFGYDSIGKPQAIDGAGDANASVNSIIGIINGVIGVLSIVAVIVVILGGVQYMTSAGDSGKVKKAKDTILYGVIGLIICALAAAIVNFVVVNVAGSNTGQQGGNQQPQQLNIEELRCTNSGGTYNSVTGECSYTIEPIRDINP